MERVGNRNSGSAYSCTPPHHYLLFNNFFALYLFYLYAATIFVSSKPLSSKMEIFSAHISWLTTLQLSKSITLWHYMIAKKHTGQINRVFTLILTIFSFSIMRFTTFSCRLSNSVTNIPHKLQLKLRKAVIVRTSYNFFYICEDLFHQFYIWIIFTAIYVEKSLKFQLQRVRACL